MTDVTEDGEFVWASDHPPLHRVWPSARAVAEDWWADWRREPPEVGPAGQLIDHHTSAGANDSMALIGALLDAAQGTSELRHVGAGPLEDLLSRGGHAAAFAKRIAERVSADQRWATAVTDVWLDRDVPDPVRRQLALLGARDFVAEEAMSRDELDHYLAGREEAGYDLPRDRAVEGNPRCARCDRPAWLVQWLPEVTARGLGPAVPAAAVEPEFDDDDVNPVSTWVAIWSCGRCEFDFSEVTSPENVLAEIRRGE